YPGGSTERPGLANRVRYCFGPPTGTPGSRASRNNCRDPRVHGTRTDRSHEPIDRLAERSLFVGGNALRDAHWRAALHRLRSPRVGPLPHRKRTNATGKTEKTGTTHVVGHRPEASSQNRRGPVPDSGRCSE